MRYYNPGDAVYFFGFSRGAYTARFLAQMLGKRVSAAVGLRSLQLTPRRLRRALEYRQRGDVAFRMEDFRPMADAD